MRLFFSFFFFFVEKLKQEKEFVWIKKDLELVKQIRIKQEKEII